jgi:hypothetical protein
MEPTTQPSTERRSQNESLLPLLTTEPLIESPDSGLLLANSSLDAGGGSDFGLKIHHKHKRELEEFRSIFNDNMRNKPVKHDHVHVLLWTWGEALDDLKVKEEVSDSTCRVITSI